MQTTHFPDNMGHMPMISPHGQQGLTTQHSQYAEPYSNTSYQNNTYNNASYSNTSAPYQGMYIISGSKY